jgi:hypothetical protein
MMPSRPVLLAAAVAAVLLGPPCAGALAQAPSIQSLRTQKVGQATYFQVRFEAPADYRAPQLSAGLGWWRARRPEFALLPRLVPQDAQTKLVCLRLRFPDLEQRKGLGNFGATVQVENLEFFGKVEGKGPARLRLLYPTGKDIPSPEAKDSGPSPLARLLRQRGSWADAGVVLDFSKARDVALPPAGFNRQAAALPDAADLEGQWALAQTAAFAVLETQAPDFGFYSFAREATARKYQVPSLSLHDGGAPAERNLLNRRLYELTTGADAIAESMALQRMRGRNFRDKGERTIDISKVKGIDIAAHPWKKMMGDRRPGPEPLARLVPEDNYYLHFKSIVKFLDLGDLMDQWGTTLTRAVEVTSRDYQLKERLERQLCLRSTGVARLFGPAVIKGLAITGSDPYVREGSDVTVIFHLINKKAFLAGVEGFLREARKEWGQQLAEAALPLQDLPGITVEQYKTPRREVSLYRVFVDDFAIYSNSLVGLRRVLEAYRGKRKALADALDFQYMRTVFRLEDPREDGFLFLSDPFLRRLVGPALRIKERRRLEGLTSLYMTTHAALFTAWQTGSLPESHNALLAHAGVKAEELFSPDGPGVFWDVEQKQAVSGVYNTLQFATPLVELPIDRITPQEEREYNQFHDEYLGLWRRYFDPVGLRVAVTNKQARAELYILPLVKTTAYNQLRQRTGGGTITVDPATFQPKTIAQFMAHIAPDAPERNELAQVLRIFARDVPGLNWLGDWFMVRFDDSEVYARLAALSVQQELETDTNRNHWQEEGNLIFQVPVTVGVQIKNRLVFAGFLAALRKAVLDALPDGIDWEPMKPAYKGVTLVQIKAKGDIAKEIRGQGDSTPAIYYALVEDGWYASLSEAALKELIDQAAQRKNSKQVPSPAAVKVNTSVFVAPAAATRAKGFLRFYLEWETHRRTMDNLAVLYPLYRCGLLAPGAPPEKTAGVALHYLGFAPVSADLAPFRYDAKRHDVINLRHGSLRQPQLHAGVEPKSPLGRLLEQFRGIRADLRFKEDGVNTVVTFDRAMP